MGFGARSFNPGDVLPPTVPVVTATRTGPQEITVTWGASSDASGVARYYIREYGVPSSEVEVIGVNRSKVYSNLAANTAFCYEVRAQDIYGNLSLYGASDSVTTLPINVAPVWSAIPEWVLPHNAGGTLDVSSYSIDPNGDQVTISLVNPPSGYTITNGVIRATADVSSATLTLSASDGSLTSNTTVRVAVSSVSNIGPEYPRLVAFLTSSDWTSARTTKREFTALHKLAIVGQWRQWDGGTITSGALTGQQLNLKTFPTWLKELNPQLKVWKYTNPCEAYYSQPAYAKATAKLSAERGTGGRRDWWLRKAGTLDNTGVGGAGQRIESWSGTYRANITTNVTPDASGLRWLEWYARYMNAKSTDTGSWVETGYGVSDSSDWEGVIQDNQYLNYAYGVTADYNDDGTNEQGGATATLVMVSDSHKRYKTIWRGLRPSALFGANVSSYNAFEEINLAPTYLNQVNELGFSEHRFKAEIYQGWTETMNMSKKGMNMIIDLGGGPIWIFHNNLSIMQAESGVTLTDARWNRYGLASALMLNCYYCVTGSVGYNGLLWTDEFDFNLGYPVDPEQLASYNATLYGTVRIRRFDNGLVIVNPKGNGTRSIALPSAGNGFKWCRLPVTTRVGGTGVQVLTDPAVNTGSTAAVESVTLTERDGLILRKVATATTRFFSSRKVALAIGNQYGTNASAAKYDRLSKYEGIIAQGWPDISLSYINTFCTEVHNRNPQAKISTYTCQMESFRDNSFATFITANNLWARSTYPSGTIQSEYPNTDMVNEVSPRLFSGKRWHEWHVDWYFDTRDYKSTDLAGLYYDNTWPIAARGYDYNENGVADSNTSTAFRAALESMLSARNSYYHAKKRLDARTINWTLSFNGLGLVGLYYWQTNPIDLREQYRLLCDGENTPGTKLVEALSGIWYSFGGYFIYTGTSYTTPSNWTGYTAWPNGFDNASVTLSAAPAVGTLCKSGFGGWSSTAGFGDGAGRKWLNMMQLIHDARICESDRSNVVLGQNAPPRSYLNHAQANLNGQLTRYWRFQLGSAFAITDFSTGINDVTTGYADVITPDELLVDYGSPLEACGLVRGAASGGYYKREFENVIWYVNPPTGTTQSVTLPSAGTGYVWRRLNAASYQNEDPTINTGAIQSGPFTLRKFDAIMFVRSRS